MKDVNKPTKEYYVLHYNTKNGSYGNNIKLTTLDKAMNRFIKEKVFNDDDRIELIHSPIDMTKENRVIIKKGSV